MTKLFGIALATASIVSLFAGSADASPRRRGGCYHSAPAVVQAPATAQMPATDSVGRAPTARRSFSYEPGAPSYGERSGNGRRSVVSPLQLDVPDRALQARGLLR